ncbi:MAG: phosphatase PAP2 family protein [Lachnospiraceae bacterium]|nr:phosphatase PAP2 family protein [Lachnospiraceae bacterium]
MTKQQYEKWSAPFRRNEKALKGLTYLNRGMTALVFAAYPLLLLYLFVTESKKCFPCALIPAVSFVLVSLFRRWYSAGRPYELLDITPLIPKDTRGKSFPSRHVFSVFIIGMTFFYVKRTLGLAVFFIGILTAFVRVIGGVHFPKDVAAGAALGVLFGLAYYIL